MLSIVLVTTLATVIHATDIPCVNLTNAALPGACMPIIGLGTGGYGQGKSPEAQPEHWNVTEGYINSQKWLSLGGRRFDTSNAYESEPGVAAGILNYTNHYTTIPRSSIWISSKLGPSKPLGYNDTIQQFKDVLTLFDTDYIDLVMIHWPSDNSSNSFDSSDKYCNDKPGSNADYNAQMCRESTWRAMQYIFNEMGAARAIGISNFELKHFMDIYNMNESDSGGNLLWLPSVNQFEFHGYWHEYDLVKQMQGYGVLVNSYAPLGTPDLEYGNWDVLLPQHPTARDIGKQYNKTAAQVWLRWALEYDIVVNPRSWNITHMEENMNILDFSLTNEQMSMLSNVTAPSDPKVCPNPQTYA